MMLIYPDHQPAQNQTVYIKRSGWSKLVQATFTNDRFEFQVRGNSVTYRKAELELGPPELSVIYWTDDPAPFLAQS